MSKRREACDLTLRRSWAWTADATRRWRRAFRLLLTEDPVTGVQEQAEEEQDGADSRGVRPRLDRSSS